MRRIIIKFRGFEITEREMIADALFFIVSFLISLFAMYIFDIHWSFYPGNTIFPPSKHVGISSDIFISAGFIGGVAGFFIIKLLLLGIKQEDKEWHRKR